jgi:acyl carrier protein
MLIKNTFRMEIPSVTEQIKEIFIKIFPKENISLLALDKSQSEFEDWDSFAHLQLVSEIEKQFNIRLEYDDIMNVNSLKDFIKLVDDSCKSK